MAVSKSAYLYENPYEYNVWTAYIHCTKYLLLKIYILAYQDILCFLIQQFNVLLTQQGNTSIQNNYAQ